VLVLLRVAFVVVLAACCGTVKPRQQPLDRLVVGGFDHDAIDILGVEDRVASELHEFVRSAWFNFEMYPGQLEACRVSVHLLALDTISVSQNDHDFRIHSRSVAFDLPRSALRGR
jgi:hypothetical protein